MPGGTHENRPESDTSVTSTVGVRAALSRCGGSPMFYFFEFAEYLQGLFDTIIWGN